MKPRSAVTVCLVPEAAGGPFVFRDDLATSCAKAADLGFDAIEVFASSADELDAHHLRNLLRTHGLTLAALGTGAGWVKHRLSLTDPDLAVRTRARQFIASFIDFAGAFGAPAIIGSMQGRHGGQITPAQAIAWLTEALEQLGPRAKAAGAPLLIEPLNRYETNLLTNVADGIDFLGKLRTTNVQLLCDLFHMNIEESDVAKALISAGAHCGHVHLADSNRRPAGNGHTDFAAVAQALNQIGYAGYLSAEALPYPDPSSAAQATIAAFRQFFAPTHERDCAPV